MIPAAAGAGLRASAAGSALLGIFGRQPSRMPATAAALKTSSRLRCLPALGRTLSTTAVARDEQSSTPAGLPSFTTSDEGFRSFVKTPDLTVISNIVAKRVPNVGFKKDLGITPEEFSDGALHAIEVVTNHLANEDDYEMLADQLTGQCLYKLNNKMHKMSREKRGQVEVHEQDVFFSWIASAFVRKSTGENEMVFVTMSMPNMYSIKKQLEENNRRAKAFMDDLKERKLPLREAKKEIDEFKAGITDPFKQFQSNSDFLVSNFRFVHRHGSWRMDEMSMRPSSELYLFPYHWRWKARLGFAIRGMEFLRVLRVDYITDLVCLSLILAYTVTSAGI